MRLPGINEGKLYRCEFHQLTARKEETLFFVEGEGFLLLDSGLFLSVPEIIRKQEIPAQDE